MDFKTTYSDSLCDWSITSPGLTEDDGLETAVIISLFTDRRANPDDVLPGGDDRRGWWGDALSEVDGDKIGSRLWLLSREKQLQSVLRRAREYAEEALRWMVEDGVARAVSATAEMVRTSTEIALLGVLGLAVEIQKPDGSVVKYRFERFWKGE